MDALPFGQYGFGIAVAIIAIMLSISGIALGLGHALDDKKLKEFGRSEIYQAIASGALVGAMIALFATNGIMTGVINSITLSGTSSFSCPAYMDGNAGLCFAYNYLMGVQPYTIAGNQYSSLFVTVSGLLVSLLGLSTLLGTIAAFKVNLLIITISFSSILSPIIGEMQYVINIVTTLALGITVQAALLSFVSLTAVTVILPAGLILRSLYATRKVGGFLIAVAIGTYVVLPMTYLLNATMVNAYSDVNSTSIIQITGDASAISSQLSSAAGVASNQTNSGVFTSIASGINGIALQLNSLLGEMLLGVSKLIMQIFILPAFSLIVTGISIKELSTLLGSEASFGKFRI